MAPWIIIGILATGLLGACVLVVWQDHRHTQELRRRDRIEGELRSENADLLNRLMYVMNKPWETPYSVPDEPEAPSEPVFADWGPEMVNG